MRELLEAERAFLLGEAVDLNRPRPRLQPPGLLFRILFIWPELVEVVVAGDVVPRGELLARGTERALFDVGEFGAVTCPLALRGNGGGERRRHGGRCGSNRGTRCRMQELAPADVERFRRDV